MTMMMRRESAQRIRKTRMRMTEMVRMTRATMLLVKRHSPSRVPKREGEEGEMREVIKPSRRRRTRSRFRRRRSRSVTRLAARSLRPK